MIRGNTFKKTLKVDLADGTQYTFLPGDKVECGFALGFLFNKKTITISEPEDEEETIKEIVITYTPEEMAKLEPGNYIFETKVTTASFTQTYQSQVEIEQDYIHE